MTSFRVIRFFPCGKMLSLLISSLTPGEVRKAAAQVRAERPHTLHQKLGPAACWGEFDLRELEAGATFAASSGIGRTETDDAAGVVSAGAGRRVLLTARVLLFHQQYPNMVPSTVRYVFELTSAAQQTHQPDVDVERSANVNSGGGATNATLHLVAHAVESGTGGGMETMAIRDSAFKFLSFDGPLPEKPFRPLAPAVQY